MSTTTHDEQATPARPAPAAATDTEGLARLRAAVRGPVLLPGEPGYAEEVATFNLAVTHRPDVVVGATSADDVAAAVAWAAARDLPVAVHATGHGPIRPVEGALLVTTARLAAVRVDPAARTAHVSGGARWADVLAAAEPHGLTAVTGSSSSVGVVGFCLGGGMGPLSRRYGFGADLVRSLDVVTADGRIRHVDTAHEPDLFWALRGGKGNFGVVTALEVELVPVPTLHAGALVFAGEGAAGVLHSFRTWSATLPDHASASVALVNLPPAETVPEPLRGRYVVMLRFAVDGSDEESAELLAPMREAGDVLLDGVSRIPSSMVDLIHQDPTDPMPTWEKGGLLGELPAPAVDALLEVAGPGRCPELAMVELRLMGGALGRPAAVPNSVAGREGAYSLFTLGVLAPPVAALVPAAGQRVHDALSPWSTGTALVNFLGGETTPEQLVRAWAPEPRERLLRVKRRVDPANLFRFGHALCG